MYNLINFLASIIIFIVFYGGFSSIDDFNSIDDINLIKDSLFSSVFLYWLLIVLLTQKYKRAFDHSISEFVNPYLKTYILFYIYIFLMIDNDSMGHFLEYISVDLFFFISLRFLIFDLFKINSSPALFYSKEKVEKKLKPKSVHDNNFDFIKNFANKDELIRHISTTPYSTLITSNGSIQLGNEESTRKIVFFDKLINDCKNINLSIKSLFDSSNVKDYSLFFYKPLEHEKEKNQVSLYKSFIHRFLPTIPFVKRVYLYLKNGRGRLISRAEMWGRLHYNGFEVIGEYKLSEAFCVVCTKASTSGSDSSPSYYPIISLDRVGYRGRIIKVYKIRSMYPYSEFIQKKAFDMFDLTNTGKINNDFRVTDYGHFIRKYWIDEVPQILNWLRGDIKIVGIRAMSLHYFSLYPDSYQKKYNSVKPGILSPIFDESVSDFNEIVSTEEKYLDSYNRNWLLADFRYFWSTIHDIIYRGVRSK